MIRGWFALTVATLVAFTAPAGPASAQPAGNAHPHTDVLAAAAAENPLGQPPRKSALDVEAKHAFSKAVDLAPLLDVAVFNGGRVKTLGTLASETVQTIAGRRDYFDVRPRDGKGYEKLPYDPLFTYLDLLIDPAYYADKALIHIQYLPLRRAFVERAYEDEAQREAWMRRTRLAPIAVFSTFGDVATKLGTDQQVASGLEHVQGVFTFLERGHGALDVVAPPRLTDDWSHISALPPEHPARKAIRAVADAWRAGDAAAVNASAAALSTELRAINPELYPSTRLKLEGLYNASRPFDFGAWMYCLSFVLLILALGTHRRWLVQAGVVTLAIAVLLHAGGFAARWAIAERVPIQNQFESMTGVALGGALVGFALMLVRRQWLFGVAAAGVGFLVLLAATQAPIPGETIGREAAILNTSVLLKYHVSTVLVSYGLITLGFFLSLMYLWTHYSARRKGYDALALAKAGLGLEESQPAGPARVLSDLDKATMSVLQLAFWTLGVGILLGAWWADHSWGRWWAFDPKETWALVTWIVYLIVIHVRVGGGGKNRGLITAWLSVAGFFVMLWTYFGVNLILPGLHAYA